jgi:hypothetical protein
MPETTLAPEPPVWAASNGADELEQRMQRLEDMVAVACDTQALEDRVVERVHEKLKSEQPPVPPPVAAFAHDHLGKHPSELELELARAPAPAAPPMPSGHSWYTDYTLLGEIWSEVRGLFRMIRDPAYRMSWLCRVVPLLCLLYVTVWSWVSGHFFGSIPVLSILDDLVVIYIGLKIIGRELRRYREFEVRWRR